MARTIDLGKVVGEGGGGLASDPREDESTESPELGSVPTNADQLGGMTYQQIVDLIYPIGRTITTLADSDNPNTLYPWQVWERTAKGRMLIGTGAPENNDDGTSPGDYNMPLGGKGGEAEHILGNKNLPYAVAILSNNETSFGVQGSSITQGTWNFSSPGNFTETESGVDYEVPFSNMPPYIAANIWKRVS